MQAGDQVAFELVGERRLVAQVIKQAEHPQVTHAPRPQLLACAGPKVAFQRKRKLDASPKSRSPRRMQKEACFREAEVRNNAIEISKTKIITFCRLVLATRLKSSKSQWHLIVHESSFL